MGIFGWSYPPGAEYDPSAPYNQDEEPCAVCGLPPSTGTPEFKECRCPECPECGETGNPDCWLHHMQWSADGVEVIRRLRPGELAPPPPLMAYQSWGDCYAFTIRGDGAKWGPSDWYDEVETALREALASGKDFDTGWYSCKKEIASARISRTFPMVTVEVSVSDDFDTQGYGQKNWVADIRTPPLSLDDLREMVDEAFADAEADRQQNQVYRGYAIGEYDGTRRTNWLATYLVNTGVGGLDLEAPPGDNYHRWGWQEDMDELPPSMTVAEVAQLEAGMQRGDEVVIVGRWCAEEWGHKDNLQQET